MAEDTVTTPVAEVPATEKEVAPSEKVASAFGAFPGAPSSEQIEQWKAKFGEVYCSGFSETELFVWRPVNRQEFTKLQVDAASSQTPVTQLDIEEKIVTNCILWASPLAARGTSLKGG